MRLRGCVMPTEYEREVIALAITVYSFLMAGTSFTGAALARALESRYLKPSSRIQEMVRVLKAHKLTIYPYADYYEVALPISETYS